MAAMSRSARMYVHLPRRRSVSSADRVGRIVNLLGDVGLSSFGPID